MEGTAGSRITGPALLNENVVFTFSEWTVGVAENRM